MRIRKLLTAIAVTAAVIGGGTRATAQTPPGPVIYTQAPSVSCYEAASYLRDYWVAKVNGSATTARWPSETGLPYSASALLVGISINDKGCMSYTVEVTAKSGYTQARAYPGSKELVQRYGYTPPTQIRTNQPSSCRYSTSLSLWYGC